MVDLDVMESPLTPAASDSGHGMVEILKVTQALEQNMPCCLVGTSALKYYGANRVRGVSISRCCIWRATDQ